MKKYRWIFPIAFTLWPVIYLGCVMLFNLLLGAEIASWISISALPWGVVILASMSIVAGGQYRVERKYEQLAQWGLLQKLTYVPMIVLLLAAGNIKWDGTSLEENEYGMLNLIVVAALGMAVLLLYGAILFGVLLGLIVSATYIIKATNALYREEYISNGVRILLVIGSLIIPLDILCAIIIWYLTKRYNRFEITPSEETLEKIEEK